MIFKLETGFVLKKFFELKHSLLCALYFLIIAGLILPGGYAFAQEDTPQGPVYIVQDGDSLWNIALRFGVSLEDLQAANNITNAGQLTLNTPLVIPGLEGVNGVLTTSRVPLGENLRSLSRRYQIPSETLIRLNHLTSPGEIYAGANLILPVQETAAGPTRRTVLAPGQSLLELAVLNGTSTWELANTSSLESRWLALPGDVLHYPGGAAPGEEQPAGSSGENFNDSPGALPSLITGISLSPTPLVQGQAAFIRIDAPPGLQLEGSLAGYDLHFFPDEGGYVAMQGIHAMAEPGMYPLAISGTLSADDGSASFSFSQNVFVTSGDYVYDPVLTVSPETIDPSITQPEDAQWLALVQEYTPEKMWDGVFAAPVPPEFAECWPSRFGSRRAYNGSEYRYFHTGLDFCGGVGTEIYAPADGVVVFAGPLTVRGNATMIDHGWGVYTGYMHQEEILVEPGDRVKAGQVIGLVGATGRVTGPHLHWEIFVGGVQVDPMEWLEQVFP